MPTLTIQQAAQYARNAGFTGNDLVTILAIAIAESNLNTDVVNSIGAVGILQLYNKPANVMANAKDPQFSFNYGYKLFKGRGKFCNWQSYDCKICGNCNPGEGWDNRYKQFVPQVQAALGQSTTTASTKTYKQGNGNPFDPTYRGQCTWWAQERYHQLTGLWTPMLGNAYQWLGQAQAAGWETGDKPPNGIPSIICMQGNAGQGLIPSLGGKYGHVAIVEKINPDGSVLTSNMDWSVGTPFQTNINTHGYPVRQVLFKPGTGVSFIWTGNAKPSASTPSSSNTGGASGGGYLTLLEQVHETLVDIPGFYGIALAIDESEQFPGWVDLTDPTKTWDVPGYIRSAGASITDNFVPFVIRGSLVGIGTFIIVLLLIKTILEVGSVAIKVGEIGGAIGGMFA